MFHVLYIITRSAYQGQEMPIFFFESLYWNNQSCGVSRTWNKRGSLRTFSRMARKPHTMFMMTIFDTLGVQSKRP